MGKFGDDRILAAEAKRSAGEGCVSSSVVARLISDASPLSNHDDGSFAWIAYGATRKDWHNAKFAKTFPKETAYRHRLPEEAEALRSVLRMAATDKKVKQLSPSLMKLKKLDDEGLLEAYILLARGDEGVSQDHPAYLAANRDKLRKYLVAYVFANGQN